MKTIIISVALCFAFIQIKAQSVEAVANANNQFGFELYKTINKPKTNLFYSPFSISAALAMTYGGARSETEKAMQHVLHFSPNNIIFHTGFQLLISKIETATKTDYLQITVANRIWLQNKFKFLDEFKDLTQRYYRAPAEYVDFADEKNREIARNKINKWVEDKTNDKIKELIKPNILNELTRMVLTNAVYFYASWEVQFEEGMTREENFYMEKTNPVKAKFMNKSAKTLYYENNIMQAVTLMYKEKASMVIFLPKPDKNIDEFEKQLTFNNFNEWRKKFKREDVELSIPKFKITNEFQLKDALTTLGMGLAFSDNADFSGMTGNKGLKIDKVIHKSFIDVTEKGTEAAAATAVVMALKSIAIPDNEPKFFVANRPFVFMIVDNETGTILFMGKVYNPSN